MERLLLPERPSNGGLPEPPAGEPVRIVAARHDACGAETRVRLPGSLSLSAVRRFHCARCAAAFETSRVEEIDVHLDLAAPVPAEDPLEAFVRSARRTVAVPEPVEPEPAASAYDTIEVPAFVPAEPVKDEPVEPEPAAPDPPKAEKPKRKLPSLPKGPKLSVPSLPSISLPTLKRPALPKLDLPKLDPQSTSWKRLSLLLAVVLVLGGLLLLRGGDDAPAPAAPSRAGTAAAGTAAAAGDKGGDKSQPGEPIAKASKDTEFVRESSFSLALPAGWERIEPPAGATFAAVAKDGSADATLWIKQDPKLDFPSFISQSLTQLEALAGSAQIVDRTPGPTPESTVVRLAADAPEGQPTYEVTLRVAGPYRYYLATSVQPDAAPEVADEAELIFGTFTPELEG
ncbi:MAG: hypothetical protein ABWY90_04945 [Solirubrobacterales bacterium]